MVTGNVNIRITYQHLIINCSPIKIFDGKVISVLTMLLRCSSETNLCFLLYMKTNKHLL